MCYAKRQTMRVPEASTPKTSFIRDNPPVGPYSRTAHRALSEPDGGGLLLMSEVPL